MSVDVQKIIEHRIDKAYTAGKATNKHIIQLGKFCRNTALIIFGLVVAAVYFVIGALNFSRKNSTIQVEP